MFVARVGVLVVFVVASAVASEPAERPSPCQVPKDVQEQIDFQSRQVREHPRRYPSLALLASAHLKRAAWTGDPADVQAARDFGRRSIEIQPNLAGFKVLAAAANYGHRFAEALPWCDKADAAAPGDRQVLAMRTEALLGLGRLEELKQLIETAPTAENDFYLPACRAQWLAATGERAAALETYRKVAELATAAKATEAALWARVAAAGVCLDSGHPQEAVPFLDEAEQLAADDPDVIVHRAEYDEATGRELQALEAYERLLARQCNPEVYRRAYRLSLSNDRPEQAAEYFRRAEELWQTALARGEVSPLEGLAGLYCDAGVRLDEAVRLAEENRKHKQDASAHEAYQRAVSLRDGQ